MNRKTRGYFMRKTFISIAMTIIMSLFILPTTSAFASEVSESPSAADIVAEISKYETPYFGVSERDYDLDKNGEINYDDLDILKEKIINSELKGATVATLVKLESWLLGKYDLPLEIIEFSDTWLDVNNYNNDILKNLMSHDFRFVRIEEVGGIYFSNDKYAPVVSLTFLGIDEYITESVLIYSFCYNKADFDEFLTENEGFALGIKDGAYSIAPLNSIKNNEAEDIIMEEDITPGEKEMASAYILYDLTGPFSYSTEETRALISELNAYLTAEKYDFSITYKTADTVQILAKTETGMATIEILVEERTPIMDTSIFENKDFYLYYSNCEGFGLVSNA
jgi:hypothetical protein